MESKKKSQQHHQQQRKQKRQQSKASVEENFWECSICTLQNSAEAFKCIMCNVRKGTSTRKPKLNQQLVAQQVPQLASTTPDPPLPPPPLPPIDFSPIIPKSKELKNEVIKEIKEKKPQIKSSSKKKKEERNPKQKIRNIRPRLKNVDRSQVHRQPITVNNVTVVITEFIRNTSIPSHNTLHQSNQPIISFEVPSSSSNHSVEWFRVNGNKS